MAAFTPQSIAIACRPGVETIAVKKVFAGGLVRGTLRRRKRTQFPKHYGVIRMAALEVAQEVSNEFVVFCSLVHQAEFRPHPFQILSLEQRLIGLEACLQRLLFRQRQQDLRQTAEVPESDVRLL